MQSSLIPFVFEPFLIGGAFRAAGGFSQPATAAESASQPLRRNQPASHRSGISQPATAAESASQPLRRNQPASHRGGISQPATAAESASQPLRRNQPASHCGGISQPATAAESELMSTVCKPCRVCLWSVWLRCALCFPPFGWLCSSNAFLEEGNFRWHCVGSIAAKH